MFNSAALWPLALSLFIISWVILVSLIDLLACWKGKFVSILIRDLEANSSMPNLDYLERWIDTLLKKRCYGIR